MRRTNLTTQDYAALAELRRQIRRFVRFSEVDRREVLLTLAPKGEDVLRKLSLQHLAELRVQDPALVIALERVTKHE